MGSAQSARRIQPGGASGRAGGFPGGSLFFPAPRFASRPLPRRDRSPTLPSRPRAGAGRGGLSPVRPGRRRAVGSGGPQPAFTPSARGRRRCRLPTRPVLKHGPRSLTRARVRGSNESHRGAMKVKRRRRWGSRPSPPPEVGSRGLVQSAEGAPPARLARRAGEVEHERTRRDPKDGELCLGRAKPEETLVEVRSGPDVQIGRPTWV